MLRIVRKNNEVKLKNGRSVYLISHSGSVGWTPQTVKRLNEAIQNGSEGFVSIKEKGVVFHTFDEQIKLIGLFDPRDDVSSSKKTRAYSPEWSSKLLGKSVA